MSETLTLPCPACGALNRVPVARLGEQPTCGKCKQTLLPGKPVVASDTTFDRQVLQSPLPVLVDFWAPWCGPCRMVGPVLEQIAAEREQSLKIVKVNSDENPGLSSRFAIRSIPTLMLFKGGRHADTIMGALPKGQLDSWLNQHLA
ncbi:MAG: hypothetical protein COX57_07830 [Alphaproteobacteria bacterium CG_4_10_14_0_2_um_filter_63_37]|nr:MAG: thioredoxin [Proteobacteria bacterium CG1_02_64_396]PJA24528.1 MAG: hypothetical protein COX57_07830 [Alphaproteobacteria bacterium CG_4_10_14_0_2_um_filter_63_37]